jgi:uncharacterized protein
MLDVCHPALALRLRGVHGTDEVTWIDCEGVRLLGLLSRPISAGSRCAVLVIVGGPQYRVGSHRQFTLLARALASRGVPVLRFDSRGMGDSPGEQRDFERTGADVKAALDHLASACPQAEKLVVWGLCDAASAALMYCTRDPRVAGLVLANPWVRSEATLAQTHLKHYYPRRVLQVDFWLKVLSGRFEWSRALGALRSALRIGSERPGPDAASLSYRERMAQGWRHFDGRILLILSGNDLTAKEFTARAGSDPAWAGLLSHPKVERFEIGEADHTFSSAAWRGAVEARTHEWLATI